MPASVPRPCQIERERRSPAVTHGHHERPVTWARAGRPLHETTFEALDISGGMPVSGGKSRTFGLANGSPGLVRNDGANVVRPVRFTAAAGRLLGLDRAATALADFPCGMSGVIFLRMPVAFVEVGIRESFALARDIAVLRCISGGHLHSLDQTPRRNAALQHPA